MSVSLCTDVHLVWLFRPMTITMWPHLFIYFTTNDYTRGQFSVLCDIWDHVTDIRAIILKSLFENICILYLFLIAIVNTSPPKHASEVL